MTIKEENASYAGGIPAGPNNDTGNGTTGGYGGGAMTSGTAIPQGFGSAKTPMYFKSVPTPIRPPLALTGISSISLPRSRSCSGARW